MYFWNNSRYLRRVAQNQLVVLGKRYPASVGILLSLLATFLAVAAFEGNGARIFIYYGAMPARLFDAWNSLVAGDMTTEPWKAFRTLLTAMFLHADAAHLLQNALFLWIFAAILEPLIGSVRLVVLFRVAGMIGNVAQAFVNPMSMAPVVGASGGVAALEGCYLSLALRYTLPWPHVWPIARPVPPHQLVIMCLINFYLDVFSSLGSGFGGGKPIAYAAHIGGCLPGGAIALWLSPRATT